VREREKKRERERKTRGILIHFDSCNIVSSKTCLKNPHAEPNQSKLGRIYVDEWEKGTKKKKKKKKKKKNSSGREERREKKNKIYPTRYRKR
jgi:hypothetical protein